MSSITDELFGLSPCLLTLVVEIPHLKIVLPHPAMKQKVSIPRSFDHISANIRFPFIQSNESAADFQADNWALLRNHVPVFLSRFPRASSKLADGIVGHSH